MEDSITDWFFFILHETCIDFHFTSQVHGFLHIWLFWFVFFSHQNLFLKSVKSFHNLLSLLHVDTNTYMKFVMEESQRLVFVIFVIDIYL